MTETLKEVAPQRSVAASEWRAGWPLILATFAGLAVSTTPAYTMGVFIGPLEREFAWSRGEITSGLLVNSVVAVTLSPIVGVLIDRIGARPIGLVGMVAFCLALASLSIVSGALWMWWTLWLFLATAAVMIKPTVWATAISKRFDAQRALALAVMLCGAGAASTLLPTFTNNLVTQFGWRAAYLTLGGTCAAIALPLLYFMLHERVGAERASAARPTKRPGLTAREAILSTRFLRLTLATLAMTMVLSALSVHFIPFLTASGLPRADAAGIAGAIGLSTIVGRLSTGLLLDRSNGPLIGATAFALPLVAAYFWLQFDGSASAAIVIAVAIGFSLGAEIDVIAYLCTRYFGLRRYGTIFGAISGVIAFGTGLGSTLAGVVYDRTGSYDAYVWAGAIAFAAAALMIASLGKYPIFVAVDS